MRFAQSFFASVGMLLLGASIVLTPATAFAIERAPCSQKGCAGLRGNCEARNVRKGPRRASLYVHLHRQRCAIHLYGVAVVALLASPAQGQELTAEWFRSNYSGAALETAYGECSAKLVLDVREEGSSQFTNLATTDFAFEGHYRKFDQTVEMREADGQVTTRRRTVVASPEVSFSITKPSDDSGPILKSVDRTPVGLMFSSRRVELEASGSIYAPFTLFSRVSERLKSPGFKIERVSREGERVRVDFVNQDKDQRHVGHAIFLANRQWAIDSYDVSSNAGELQVRQMSQISYSEDSPVPRLAGSVTKVIWTPGKTFVETLSVKELTFQPKPATEFKLSHYGYDDRTGMPPGSMGSLWLWAAIAGIGCILLSFVIRRRLRRAAA